MKAFRSIHNDFAAAFGVVGRFIGCPGGNAAEDFRKAGSVAGILDEIFPEYAACTDNAGNEKKCHSYKDRGFIGCCLAAHLKSLL